MKTIISALISATFATSAIAVGIGNDNPPSSGGATTVEQKQQVAIGVSAEARAAAAAFAAGGAGGNSKATGGSAKSSATGGAGGVGGNAAATGGNNSLVINEASAPSKVVVRNNPDIVAGNIHPTANCMGGVSVGISAGGVGATAAGTVAVDHCEILETARSFDQSGHPEDGMYVRCQSKWAKVAPSCIALQPKGE